MPYDGGYRNRSFDQGTSFSPYSNYGASGGDFAGGQFGQQSPLSGLLAMLGNNKGLFGMGDVATGGLFSAGGALLGGLGELLGGKSEQEKALIDSRERAKQVFSMAQNRMGQNVLQPEQYLADYKRSQAGTNQRMAERINQRLGLDTGAAQTDIAFKMQAPLAQFMLNAKMQNDMLKSSNDNMLMRLMGSLGRT